MFDPFSSSCRAFHLIVSERRMNQTLDLLAQGFAIANALGSVLGMTPHFMTRITAAGMTSSAAAITAAAREETGTQPIPFGTGIVR